VCCVGERRAGREFFGVDEDQLLRLGCTHARHAPARGLWDVVIVGTTDYTEDRLALEVIAKVVPPELMGSIVSKPTTMVAWESLVLRNVGVDRVRKAKASTLKREFDSLTFEAGESIDDFGTRLSRIINQLAVLGFEYKEEEIMRRFLAALPPKFE
jgi:hypothetical protein